MLCSYAMQCGAIVATAYLLCVRVHNILLLCSSRLTFPPLFGSKSVSSQLSMKDIREEWDGGMSNNFLLLLV